MIVKHVPMKSLGRSDFASLAKYITDSQSKDHRLGSVEVSNCESGNLLGAIEEILATQHQNTRAKSDKTYHLIVSFRPGEEPSDAVLKAIEARICDGLGYGDHQRVSAVHRDTDNLHIHLAINKIHPERNTIHEPYYPHRTLAALCQTLEADYGLEPDNHVPNQSRAAGRATDMEQHAGVESLVGWIKRECLDDIRQAQSWETLHQVMSANGLTLRARGNGLVVEAGNGVAVKASTLARDLSRSALEKRLGPFEAQSEQQAPITPKRSYQKNPLPMRVDTTELYARYQSSQLHLKATQSEWFARAKTRKDRAVHIAKSAYRLRRAAIKLVDSRQFSKRLLYAQAHNAFRCKLDAIHQDYADDRRRVFETHCRSTWADWLKSQAVHGCSEALSALRSRDSARGLKGHTVTGRGKVSPGHSPEVDHITKKGTVVFKGGRSAVRDDGQRVQVSREANLDAVKTALALAAQRYGNELQIEGTAEFKAQVILAAAESNLPITFLDPGLERRRQHLTTQKEQGHAQPTRQTSARGRPDRRGTGAAGGVSSFRDSRIRPVAGRTGGAPRTMAGQHGGRTRTGTNPYHKPHLGPIGQVPPAQSQHSLRTLSQLGVVQFAHGSEVLLPRDVPDYVEHQGSKPDHPLRWIELDLDIRPQAWSAARRYIQAEASKFLRKKDITKISRYTASSKPLAFEGMCSQDGHALALFKREHELLVMPVNPEAAKQLSQLAIGEVVGLVPKGAIHTHKGRSR